MTCVLCHRMSLCLYMQSPAASNALPLQHSQLEAQQPFSHQLAAERVQPQPIECHTSQGDAHGPPSDPAQNAQRNRPFNDSQAFHDPQSQETGVRLQGAWPMPEQTQTPDHSAGPLSSTPILAPKPGHSGAGLHQQIAQSATPAANVDTATSTRHMPVLSSTPLLLNHESTRKTLPNADASISHDSRPNLAIAQQHSLSVAPAEDTDQILEGQLSARQRALRSLSSKGIQMRRTASGKGSGELCNLQASGSGNYGKLSLGLRQGQRQGTEESNSHVAPADGKIDGGVNNGSTAEPLPQGAGAVRVLASRLDSLRHSHKHIN